MGHRTHQKTLNLVHQGLYELTHELKDICCCNSNRIQSELCSISQGYFWDMSSVVSKNKETCGRKG